MHVECFTVGSFSVNTYLLTDEATGLSAIVDTGETNELIPAPQGADTRTEYPDDAIDPYASRPCGCALLFTG